MIPVLDNNPRSQSSVNHHIYDSPLEEQRHLAIINSLAQELQISAKEIVSLYEDTLSLYKSRAEIKDYLPVLVYKRVKEAYRIAAKGIIVSGTNLNSK